MVTSVVHIKSIIAESDPYRGRIQEAQLTQGQTPKPGTCMYETSAGTWSVGNGASNGSTVEVVVALEDIFAGKLPTDAYADIAAAGSQSAVGARVRLYFPCPGDRLYMLLKDVSGTGDTYTIGQYFGIEAASGKLLVDSSFTLKPFILTNQSDPGVTPAGITSALTADGLYLFRYTGH